MSGHDPHAERLDVHIHFHLGPELAHFAERFLMAQVDELALIGQMADSIDSIGGSLADSLKAIAADFAIVRGVPAAQLDPALTALQNRIIGLQGFADSLKNLAAANAPPPDVPPAPPPVDTPPPPPADAPPPPADAPPAPAPAPSTASADGGVPS